MEEQHNKRLKSKNKKKRNIIIIIIAMLIIIASIIFYILRSNSADLQPISEVQFDNSVNLIDSQLSTTNSIDDAGVEFVDASDIPAYANGLPVLGRIVIDKIGINCLIFHANNESQAVHALKFRYC